MKISSLSFLGIEEIVDQYVVFSDNTMVQVLEIEPIDYDNLPKSKQQQIEELYESWLNTLSFPIQIVVRNVNKNLINQSTVLKNSIEYQIKQKDLQKELLELYDSFTSWFNKHIKSCIEKKLYYIVVPYYNTKKLYNKPLFKKRVFSKEFDRGKRILTNRVKYIKRHLENIGLGVKELKIMDIVELYSSYFALYMYNNKTKHYEVTKDIVSLWGDQK